MKYTLNYSLNKPDLTDMVNIDDFNTNVDKIDEELKKVNDSLTKSVFDLTSQLDIIETEKATKIEVVVERKRVDNLVKISSGEVDNVEISDARVGADGVEYDSVGEALRSQFTNSTNKLDNIVGEKVEYPITWNDGGYINNTDGNLVIHEGWKYTDFIIIGENTKELICKTTLTGSFSYNAFYDVNEKCISNFSVKNGRIAIPKGAYSFRLSIKDGDNTGMTKVFDTLTNKCNAEDVKKIAEEVDDVLIKKYLGIKVDYSINWVEGGYIDNTNGSFVEYNGWFYTNFIEIDERVKQLEFDTTLTGSFSYNAFYDENEVFIKNIHVNNKLVDKPSNAKYIRLSVNRGAKTVIRNKINKLIEKCTLEEVRQMLNNSVSATDIITLNKDVEPFVIQASEGLGQRFANKTKPLVFTHFSDVHTRQELWNRVIQYNNHYSKYINFSIHTGDYCGGNQSAYVDLYKNGQSCKIPVYNCVGNHDTFIDNTGTKGTKQKTKELLFNHTENWNVVFMDIEHSMTYYKDFPNNRIRFIVMDYYYDIDTQCNWLLERLNGARDKGYHVVTCMHEMTNIIKNKLDTPFQTIDNFESLGGNKHSISKFDKVIGDWVKAGGIHVANFAGHEHSDFIGYTDNGVLNICVQAATDDIIWTDAKRIQDTKTWDCFNIVGVEVSTGILKLIRVGNNSDHYLREKKLLSYDYINKRIIVK